MSLKLKRLKIKTTSFRHTKPQGDRLREISKRAKIPRGAVICKLLDCPIETILELISD